MRLSNGDRWFVGIIYVSLALFTFIALYPFWNAAAISFNSGTDTMQGGITFWPREFTLENYHVVFKDERLIDGFIISVLRTLLGTLLSIVATAILAYGISKRELMGRNFYMVTCIITMYFSGGLIPNYLLIRELGLMNSFWVMVIPGIISVWNMIIFRTFFKGIPPGLEESARID
ncbi:carbohydrate ABC transporter permease, partial [Paenibacillus tundrae]